MHTCKCGLQYKPENIENHKTTLTHANYLLKLIGCKPMKFDYNKEYFKEYRSKNKDKIRAYNKYYYENPK